MEISKEYLEDFKKTFKDKYGKEYTDQEAYEAAYNLMGFVDVLIKSAQRQLSLERRLKKEPQGFPVSETYSCRLCGRQVSGEETWYDKWGVKCLLCQKAVDEGIVPGFAVRESDSRYSMWQLESKFKIKWQTARKLVRQKLLKARIVAYPDGKPYEYIFLKKENPDLIDPERYSPARKSYNKHQEKMNKIYIKEKITELREKFNKSK